MGKGSVPVTDVIDAELPLIYMTGLSAYVRLQLNDSPSAVLPFYWCNIFSQQNRDLTGVLFSSVSSRRSTRKLEGAGLTRLLDYATSAPGAIYSCCFRASNLDGIRLIRTLRRSPGIIGSCGLNDVLGTYTRHTTL